MIAPHLVVFDLDGTLVDSRRDLADATNALLAERGAAPLPQPVVVDMVGGGVALLVERAFGAAGLGPATPDAVPRFIEIYEGCLLDYTRPYPGVIEMLQAASRLASLAVLTNKPDVPAVRILDGLGLARYFREIVGGTAGLPRKPDPASLHRLIGDAGAIPGTTLMVGDSRIDLETARNAGTRAALAAWGFGFRTLTGVSLDANEFVLDKPADLAGLLR